MYGGTLVDNSIECYGGYKPVESVWLSILER